jgi:hypothetical protein
MSGGLHGVLAALTISFGLVAAFVYDGYKPTALAQGLLFWVYVVACGTCAASWLYLSLVRWT